MPEDNLYSAYKAGGKIEGEYTSGIQEVQDTWSVLDYNKRLGSARQDKLSKAVDTIGAGLQLGSTVYGGWQDKQKFEGESMPAAQQMIAKESYDAEKHGGINWETFQKGDKYEDYLGGFAPKKVEMSMFDSLFADEASYTIGDQEFKKSDISLMGKISKAESLAGSIGSNTRDVLDAQQSMAAEVSEQEDELQNVLSTSKQALANVGNQSVSLSDPNPYLNPSLIEDEDDNNFNTMFR